MTLPASHPQRLDLHAEVHARPPLTLKAPAQISFLAMIGDAECQRQQWSHLRVLCSSHGVDIADEPQGHLQVDLGAFRIKHEKHTEFSQFNFITQAAGTPFSSPAIRLVPEEWLKALPGQLIVATHVAFEPPNDTPLENAAPIQALFGGNDVVGSIVSGGAAAAVTDFRVHADGFGRILVRDYRTTPRQAGRVVQRLLEIETYRMMALLAFPIARQLSPELTGIGRELADIAQTMTHKTKQAEASLLDRLMALEAEIERRYAQTQFRFNASNAYHDLVERRIVELREQRLEGMQTIREFMERRLTPAMATCRATAHRVDALSERIGRATQLLSTRVDVTREAQNLDLLAGMARRAKLQLRLQQTVEGLSAAAITYYVVGLVGYAAKGLYAMSLPVRPDLVTAISIPIVLAIVVLGVKRIRRLIGLE